MPPYYDVYFGNKKCKLFIKDKKYDVFMKDSSLGEAYGVLSYTYDERDRTFRIKVDSLSERGQYLLNKGELAVAVDIQNNKDRYRGPNLYRHRQSLQDYPIRKAYSEGYRGSKRWFSTDGISPIRLVDISKEILFKVDDMDFGGSSGIMRMVRNDMVVGDVYFDIKFCLRRYHPHNANYGRFLKTICEPFRLTIEI